ncbi:MAG TPA: hypothetical protein VJ783_03915 [Pirellulales bacterium]|nr:hypothetical protein [Pirellulales bacterium]
MLRRQQFTLKSLLFLSGIACLYTCYGCAERSGPFTYRIKSNHRLQAPPGEYNLKLVEGYHLNEPSVFGQLVVQSQ